MVLLARVRALLRRVERGGRGHAANARPDLMLGALRISETSREVWLSGKPVALTTQEFELLSLLAHRAGELVSRDEVFRTMRGIDYDGLDRSIDGRVSKLRRKLGDDAAAPTRIKTVWGKGYLLVPDAWDLAVLKDWLTARHRGLFIRSYVVLAGGLLVVAVLLDARLRRAAVAPGTRRGSVARFHVSSHGVRARAPCRPPIALRVAAQLAQKLGLEIDLLDAGDIAGAQATRTRTARAHGAKTATIYLPVSVGGAARRDSHGPVRAGARKRADAVPADHLLRVDPADRGLVAAAAAARSDACSPRLRRSSRPTTASRSTPPRAPRSSRASPPISMTCPRASAS